MTPFIILTGARAVDRKSKDKLMGTNYSADRTGLQRLLALCKRNLRRLDETDREIVRRETNRFYDSGRRGQKGKLSDQK